MAKQTINIGSIPNDGTGTTLRDGGDLINDNFNEIYSAIGNGTSITLTSTPTELNLLSGVTALVTISSSDTFTNKAIDGTTNTLSNIGNSSLVNSSFTLVDESSTATTISLGDTLKITGGTGIDTTVSGDTITVSIEGTVVTESSSDTLTNKAIDGSTNTLSNIGNASLSNSSITFYDDTSSASIISLGNALTITGGTGVTSTVSGSVITIAGSDATTSTKGIASFDTGDFTVTSGAVTIKTGGVDNAQLANASFTLGSDTINLGDTTTTVTGLSLDGTGTIDLTGAGSKMRFNFANFGSLPNSTTYQGMFATDSTTAKAYYAEGGGWNEIVTENSSIGLLSNVDITSSPPTQGEFLVFNSSNGRFEPGGFTTATFSGDGSTTIFTINADRNVNDILVFVDGICKVPTTDYTVSGTDLTFGSAPAGSTTIMVRYLG
jgi:hypothetical protein